MTGLEAAGRLALVASTQFGDTWFLFALLLIVHWHRPPWIPDRRASGVVIGIAILAIASVLTVKTAVGAPRPPGAGTATVPAWLPAVLAEAVRDGATADGYGFPSGHATVTTAVYGGLAAIVGTHRQGCARRYYSAAAGLIILVAASRVALGVHYPRDVLGGILLGSLVLAVGLWLEDPIRIFGLASLVALTGTILAGAGQAVLQGPETAGALGAAIGGLIAWRWSGPVESRVPVGLLAVGGAVLTASWVIAVSWDTVLVVAAGNALTVGLGIGLPAILDRNPLWQIGGNS